MNSPEIAMQRLGQRLLMWVAILMLPALILSTVRAQRIDENYTVVALQLLVYGAVCYLSLPFRHTTFKHRIYFLAFAASLVGIGALMRNPDPAIGMAYLVCGSIFLITVSDRNAVFIMIATSLPLAGALSYFLWQHDWAFVIGRAVSFIGLAAITNVLVFGIVSYARGMLESERFLRQELDDALNTLKAEEQRRDAIAAAADIAFLEYDFETNSLQGDNQLRRRFGRENDSKPIKVDDYLGKYSSEDLQIIARANAKILASQPGESVTCVHKETMPDGSVNTLRLVGVRSEREGRTTFLGASINITHEARALEDATEHSALLDLMSEAGGIGVLARYPDTDEIRCNAVNARRLGREPTQERFPADSYHKLLSPSGLAKRLELDRQLQTFPVGKIQKFDEMIQAASGEELRLRIVRMRTHLNGEEVFLGVSVDVTAETQAKELAEQTVDQLNLLTAKGDIGLFELNITRGYFSGNSVELSRLGLPLDTVRVPIEVLYKSLPPEAVLSAHEEIEKLNQSEDGYQQESVLEQIFSDGSRHVIRVSERKTTRNGDVVVSGAAIDITKESDAITTAQQSMARLQAQQQRQSEMYAVIGHELRTPAASLQMMLDTLEEGEELDKSLVGTNIEQLLSVIDTLRAVAQPERLARAEFSEVALDEVLAHQIENFLPQAKQQGVQLISDLSGLSGHRVSIQKTLLRQVTSNLIKNALIHSGATEVRLHANSEIAEEGGISLRIELEDNGRGIPEEQIASLFEAFVRGATDAEGTGLGLHVCRQIINDMGGELVYQTNLKGGASFIIELKLALAKDNVETVSQPTLTDLKGMRVLVAEDNRTIQMLTERLLTKQGATVELARDGLAGLAAFKNGEFDLVLSDIFMPDMNGYELAHQIRKLDSEVPLIGLTAATIGEETDRMLEAGANAVLSKPVSLERLLNVLTEMSSSSSLV
ncbi:MAG TPA: response regulator [Marinobacterium sp.]|nr:response regulator [Marinobacterium sp.]